MRKRVAKSVWRRTMTNRLERYAKMLNKDIYG